MEIVGFSQSIQSKNVSTNLARWKWLSRRTAARELRCEPLVVIRAMKRPWTFVRKLEALPQKLAPSSMSLHSSTSMLWSLTLSGREATLDHFCMKCLYISLTLFLSWIWHRRTSLARQCRCISLRRSTFAPGLGIPNLKNSSSGSCSTKRNF